MSDEVDDLLRRTMATLDRQVPDGYFDTLVSRALARLDDPALARAARTGQASDPAPASAAIDHAAMSGRRGPSNRRPIVAVVGLGLAAAVGAMIFVGTHDQAVRTPELAVLGHDRSEEPAGNVAQAARPVAPAVDQGAAVGKLAEEPIATKGRGKAGLTDVPTKWKGRSAGKTVKGTGSGHDGELPTGKPSKQSVRAPNGDEPEFVQPSLSSDDVSRGMAAVAGKAKACFAGTQGTATVQLTIAPSGRVQKVTVTGSFAGTPTGACVEQAVKVATFPRFDGGPESFAYDYLISN